jgi:prepilin-type N-terminal cleavage/methylation domain-containing protein
MLKPLRGFTLLEVLIALNIITIGLLGLLGTLGPMTKLAGQGRARGRAALMMASRADLLRTEVKMGAPACVIPSGGSSLHPDGVFESWRARSVGASIELEILAGRDTLVTRVPCP